MTLHANYRSTGQFVVLTELPSNVTVTHESSLFKQIMAAQSLIKS